ncbi:phosphoribosylformylglycinamidine synthase [Selenomonas sp. oral taxon 920]|uniref:phosphoribosylformylglycinamidine synthase n=1 Tax=Selenomonas sp. oral taxon 920 TaxID=1884263 RepID=UPI000840D6DA|nr:phosphoribosylformylglycinamidine synthase [Selenomonas sp. oral taxon 920]AOH47425.1 phosphoribosylformylglycinamidine synthase [Selenomonas sp. oral taxon 920]
MAVKRIFVEKRQGFFDIPAQRLCSDLVETFRLTDLRAVRLITRYDIEGLNDEEFAQVRSIVFADPPVDTVYEDTLPLFSDARVFAIEPLPGQFDPTAAAAAECVQLVTQGERPDVRSARVVVLVGKMDDRVYEQIKAYLINKVESREASLATPATLESRIVLPADVEILKEFNHLSHAELEQFHREHGFAMSVEDLAFVQQYFRDTERRVPTITELRVIDTYWSDHCRHTTFTTAIDAVNIENGPFSLPIFETYQRYMDDRKMLYMDGKQRDVTLMDIAVIGMKALRAEGKLDDLDESEEINACSIRITVDVDGKDEDWLLMFKNETHNHPTEIEPFGGAATCLGGAIRDPLSGRSYVYQAMRVTGAFDPRMPIEDTLPGKLPQKKITLGAAEGYSSYGNQIGLATGQVREIYHKGYLAKRMEIGAVIGAAPAAQVVRKRPAPGDVIVLLGGRTGRDGIGGATGSSKQHTESSLTTSGAEVQKGNPPTERKIQRLFRNPEVSRMIKRCNDFGAGGVAVAIGELADGLTINLDAVPKKYEGLDGTELAISESQERMAVVLSPKDVPAFLRHADVENLEATEVARVTAEPILVMKWRDKEIVRIARSFLATNGVRQRVRVIVEPPNEKTPYLQQVPQQVKQVGRELEDMWLANLSDLNVCSQKGLGERFDATVGAASVLMPFGGKYQLTPSEAMVAKLPVRHGETNTASAMAFGFDPDLSTWSPFHGAVYAVVEAVAKIVATGGEARRVRLTLQEYFERLGTDPKKWGKPFAALLGALRAQHELGIPAIGGKDSMSGTFENLNVPPTLVAFAVATMRANEALSPEFKYPGNTVVMVPVPHDAQDLPVFARLNTNFEKVHQLIADKKAFSAISVGRGGIAAAISKMCLGNNLGFKFTSFIQQDDLFKPLYGTLLLEVSPSFDIAANLAGTGAVEIGKTRDVPSIITELDTIVLADVKEAYTAPLEKIFPTTVPQVVRQIDRPTYAPYKQGKIVGSSVKIAKPRVCIPVFPGTNCEYDSARAWERSGAIPEIFVVRNLTPKAVEETVAELAASIRRAQILMLPGGFSGGDEPDGTGKFIAAMFRAPALTEAVQRLLRDQDGLILGICNGFQALLKLGLLPYGKIVDLDENSPTLTYNNIGRHVSQTVRVRVASNLSPWLSGVNVGDTHTIAVSHGEGRFYTDAKTVANMRIRGQIATQYVNEKGEPTLEQPYNPNGSVNAIEGITSPDGRIYGRMAHAERIGENISKNVPGEMNQMIFESGVSYFIR